MQIKTAYFQLKEALAFLQLIFSKNELFHINHREFIKSKASYIVVWILSILDCDRNFCYFSYLLETGLVLICVKMSISQAASLHFLSDWNGLDLHFLVHFDRWDVAQVQSFIFSLLDLYSHFPLVIANFFFWYFLE